jgi:hypothetical protein
LDREVNGTKVGTIVAVPLVVFLLDQLETENVAVERGGRIRILGQELTKKQVSRAWPLSPTEAERASYDPVPARTRVERATSDDGHTRQEINLYRPFLDLGCWSYNPHSGFDPSEL